MYGYSGHQLEDLAALQRSTLAASLPQLVSNSGHQHSNTKGVRYRPVISMTPSLVLSMRWPFCHLFCIGRLLRCFQPKQLKQFINSLSPLFFYFFWMNVR